MAAAESTVAVETTDSLLSAEEARREKLKKAGAEYFERVLAQSNRGKEAALPAKEAPAAREPYDDTFATVGAVVEGSKLYVLSTLFIVCQSTGMVFTKSSLEALESPATLVFLHFLPLVCALWLLSAQGILDLRPFSSTSVHGSLPSATITGLEALFFFFSLSRCSLPVVLSWVTVVPHIIQAVLDAQLNKSQIQPGRLAGLLLGIVATAAALFFGELPGLAGGAALALWAATEALSLLWAACRRRPHLLVTLLGESRGEILQRVTEVEGSVDAPTLAFMRHALPALPIMVLGLILGEGRELVEHELSVPAVTAILVSIAAFGLGIVSLLLISDGLPREARAALAAAPPLGTAVVEVAVRGVASPLAFSGAVVAVTAGLVLRMASAA